MDSQSLLEIAATWSFWDKPIPNSTKRTITLPASLSNKVALVVQGVRRSGKSTLLTQLLKRYRLKKKDCLFINFEDPRMAGALNHETLEQLVQAFSEARSNTEVLTVFLDEIQWVDGWERWLRSKLERPGKFQFVISGSNAHLLSGELATALSGRHITVELFPFDFEESVESGAIKSLEEYLHHGGFPEPLMTNDGDLLRRQYFLDIIQRDITERVGARSSQALRQIVQMAFESAGSEMSLRRIAGASGVAVDTVAGYLEACEQAYLLFPCRWFAWSERKRLRRNVKYYPVDTGLRRIAVTRTGQDLGKSLECATYIGLRKKYGDVFYWRDKGEVDFVVQTNRGVTPLQVTLNGPDDRHHRSLELFYESFPQSEEAVFVTLENFPELDNLLGV